MAAAKGHHRNGQRSAAGRPPPAMGNYPSVGFPTRSPRAVCAFIESRVTSTALAPNPFLTFIKSRNQHCPQPLLPATMP